MWDRLEDYCKRFQRQESDAVWLPRGRQGGIGKSTTWPPQYLTCTRSSQEQAIVDVAGTRLAKPTSATQALSENLERTLPRKPHALPPAERSR